MTCHAATAKVATRVGIPCRMDRRFRRPAPPGRIGCIGARLEGRDAVQRIDAMGLYASGGALSDPSLGPHTVAPRRWHDLKGGKKPLP